MSWWAVTSCPTSLKAPLKFSTVLALENGYAVDRGKQVTFFGYPSGPDGPLERSTGTLTARLYPDAPGDWAVRHLSRFSAQIKPGFSGGPVLDRSGAVVALAVARLASAPHEESYGIGTITIWFWMELRGFAPTPARNVALSEAELEGLAAATTVGISCAATPPGGAAKIGLR